MSTMLESPVTGRGAWTSAEIANDRSWIHHVSEPEIAELDRAMRSVRNHGLDLGDVTKRDFPLDLLGRRLAVLARELRDGRGCILIRGFPVAEYGDEEAATVFWGLGTHLGRPIRQNARGDVLGHVYDEGTDPADPNVRGYRTAGHLPFHTDVSSDIVGLMCLRTPKSGGLSRIASALTIYNEVLRDYPGYLDVYYNGFVYDRRNEHKHGESPTFVNPVFQYERGALICRYTRAFIDAAQRKGTAAPLEAREAEALQLLDRIAHEPRMHFDMQLEAGDMQLLNNRTVLHSRTDYVDHADPARKRHLLRLWLVDDDSRAAAGPYG